MSKKQTTGKKESVIQNYGLFWRVERVVWGTKGEGKGKGTLLGRARESKLAKKEGIVDFREQKGIYALYSNYKLVYVGQTRRGVSGTLFNRLKYHRNHKVDDLSERWDMFSWFGMLQPLAVAAKKAMKAQGDIRDLYRPKKELKVAPSVALDMLEAVSIAISEPRLNFQRGKWKSIGATQYYQWWQDDAWDDDWDENETE